MLNRFLKILLCVGLSQAGVASAGGWASGGGELFKDARNPWFLDNTKTVKYCITIDDAQFGLPLERVTQAVSWALKYWKQEFLDASQGDPDVGSQDFQLVDCQQPVDLTFQFGVLSKEQQDYLRDPTQFAAITVRTDYDKVNLRGKGFIYVAPESGALRPSSVDLTPHPWSMGNGRLLELTLLHELGHVFGLSNASYIRVMSSDYIQTILNKNAAPHAVNYPDPALLKFKKFTHEHDCAWGRWPQFDLRNEFFGIPASWDCMRAEIEPESVKIFAKEKAQDTSWQFIGEAKLTEKIGQPLPYEMPIWIYLTNEQTAYPARTYEGSSPIGPFYARDTKVGTYRSANGSPVHEIFADLHPDYVRLGGVFNNRIITDLFVPRLSGGE